MYPVPTINDWTLPGFDPFIIYGRKNLDNKIIPGVRNNAVIQKIAAFIL